MIKHFWLSVEVQEALQRLVKERELEQKIHAIKNKLSQTRNIFNKLYFQFILLINQKELNSLIRIREKNTARELERLSK